MGNKPIMVGRISSINYKRGCADVVLPDEEDVVKTDLPFFSCEYRMPKVGELVVVLFQKYQNRDQGYILGPIFNEEYLPEFKGKDNYFKRLSKRVYVKYDDETGVLTIKAPKIRLVQED